MTANCVCILTEILFNNKSCMLPLRFLKTKFRTIFNNNFTIPSKYCLQESYLYSHPMKLWPCMSVASNSNNKHWDSVNPPLTWWRNIAKMYNTILTQASSGRRTCFCYLFVLESDDHYNESRGHQGMCMHGGYIVLHSSNKSQWLWSCVQVYIKYVSRTSCTYDTTL